MNRCELLLGWWTALLLAASGMASAQAPAGSKPPVKRDPAAMSVSDIMACMRENTVDRGSLRQIEMTSVDRTGSSTRMRMKLFWKPPRGAEVPRTLLRVVEPADVSGASVLSISKPEGDEVYLYLPELARVQRVTGDHQGDLFGTDFGYGDFKQIQALVENSGTRRLADQKALERAAFVLDVATTAKASGYTRIKSYVDQATCTLLRSEFFVGSSEPRKVLEADPSTLLSIGDGEYWLVLGYIMKDVAEGTQTRVSLSDVCLLEWLPEELFDPATFYRVDP